jgi:FAD/FMN-containing dehydrogenase
MLGGGLGRLQGLHGLTSDAVQKVRLALWNGDIVDASKTVNPDLFYGVRGSGQNYGIIIETTYKTYPATNGGKYYNADMVFNKSAVEGIMNIINNFTTPALDPKASFITFFALNSTTSKVSQRVHSPFVRH